MKEEYIQVTTTTANKEDAQKIARALVEQRLAACVQVVGPIESTYWWKGQIETAQEWLCVAKTRGKFYKKVEKAIKAMHPYEVPEIVAVEIREGSDEYLRWVHEELRLDKRGGKRRGVGALPVLRCPGWWGRLWLSLRGGGVESTR